VEFQAASITSNGNGGGPAAVAHIARNNPHFALYTDQRGYQRFDVRPKIWTTDVKVMDRVETPGGSISTLASFVVTLDAPVLHRG
jgi:alkaline phosphatase D